MLGRFVSALQWVGLAVLALRQHDEEVRATLRHVVAAQALDKLWVEIAKVQARIGAGDASEHRAMADAFAEQLEDIGQILVRAGVLTQEAIGRHGVRFAVFERFELTDEPAAPPAAPLRAARDLLFRLVELVPDILDVHLGLERGRLAVRFLDQQLVRQVNYPIDDTEIEGPAAQIAADVAELVKADRERAKKPCIHAWRIVECEEPVSLRRVARDGPARWWLAGYVAPVNANDPETAWKWAAQASFDGPVATGAAETLFGAVDGVDGLLGLLPRELVLREILGEQLVDFRERVLADGSEGMPAASARARAPALEQGAPPS